MTITLSNAFIISEIQRLIDKEFNIVISTRSEGNITRFFTAEGLTIIKVTIFSTTTNNKISIHISSNHIPSEKLYALAEKIDNKYGNYLNIHL